MENQASENYMEKIGKIASSADLNMWSIMSNLYQILEQRKGVCRFLLSNTLEEQARKDGNDMLERLNGEIKKLLAL